MVKDYPYVIGVDGGGTKTLAVLADLNGKVIKRGLAGSSNPRNVGINAATANIAQAIAKILKQNPRISSTIIGLPGMEEEYKNRKQEIIRALKKHKIISRIFGGKIDIVSDQLVAFRAGASARDGISVIAGTGCAAHGWLEGREAKANGWGWLADEGSGFWIGQKVFQIILKTIDGRSSDKILTGLAQKTLKIKKTEDLVNLAYKNPQKIVSSLAGVCRLADEIGDDSAHKIMESAGKEIALSVVDIAKRLDFGSRIPEIVFVGGIFNSKTAVLAAKKDLQKYFGKAPSIIIPELPAVGAIKLAIEGIE